MPQSPQKNRGFHSFQKNAKRTEAGVFKPRIKLTSCLVAGGPAVIADHKARDVYRLEVRQRKTPYARKVVNDASTGLLMADFYKRWADGAGKVTKVEALRQAQVDLLLGKTKRQGDGSDRGFGAHKSEEKAPAGYAHPYYWAPFVLMGN